MATRPLLMSTILAGLLAGFTAPALAGDLGVLRIVTEPGDAQIFIDGKRKGNSPSEAGQSFAIKLEEGSHVVEAVKPDGAEHEYVGRKDDVFVADGTMQTLTLKLQYQQTAEGKRAEEERNRIKAAENAEKNRIAAEEEAKRENEKNKQMKLANAPIAKGMVTIPAGTFRMGCEGSRNCDSSELPAHTVAIKSFEMGRTEVTFEQWDACVADQGCSYSPSDRGWGRGNRPVINVSWDDVQTYLGWLNRKTGKKYRLPTEAEWEYAARAGAETAYSWGESIGVGNANCNGCGSQWDNNNTAPVGSFKANAFGLLDMHGNVWEWVQDCYEKNYAAAADGSAMNGRSSCNRVMRGGGWYSSNPWKLRSAYRDSNYSDRRLEGLGFRLARTLP